MKQNIFVNWDKVLELSRLQFSALQIASSMRISLRTLEVRARKDFGMPLSEVLEAFCSEGKILIMRELFKRAEQGDSKVLIFLAKAICGYSEKSEINLKTREPIQFKFVNPDGSKDESGASFTLAGTPAEQKMLNEQDMLKAFHEKRIKRLKSGEAAPSKVGSGRLRITV